MILEAVQEKNNHPSADEIYLDVREKNEKISRGTVYRNLGILTKTGDIMRVRTSNADRYDARIDKHYHMVCKICNKVYDAPIEYSQENDSLVEEMTGFKIDRHRTIFEGYCKKCLEKQKTRSGDKVPDKNS